MTVDTTPGRDVLKYTGVSAMHGELIPATQIFDSVLGFDNRHGTEQSPGIKDKARHAMIALRPPMTSVELVDV